MKTRHDISLTAALIIIAGLACSAYSQNLEITAVNANTLSWTHVTNRYILEKADSLQGGFSYVGDVLSQNMSAINPTDSLAFYRIRKVRVIQFGDASLRTAVTAQLPLKFQPANEVYDLDDLDSLRTLDVSGRSITSMRGIEEFGNVTNFVCSGNSLQNLDVSALKQLEYLDCSQNSITNLLLPSSTSLRVLKCTNNSSTGTLNLVLHRNLDQVITTGTPFSEIQLDGYPTGGINLQTASSTKRVIYISGVAGVVESGSSSINVTLHDEYGVTYDQMIGMINSSYYSADMVRSLMRQNDVSKPSGLSTGTKLVSHDDKIYSPTDNGLGDYLYGPGVPLITKLEIAGPRNSNGVIPVRVMQVYQQTYIAPSQAVCTFYNNVTRSEALAMTSRLGVTVISESWHSSYRSFIISVPLGQELKWAAALQSCPEVRFGEANGIVYAL